ncbi:MAG: TIGR01777 family oxidoreductase [Methylophaga sp.]|nr:TIGR01777 family oxidoreductase [Methylophaga sp.]
MHYFMTGGTGLIGREICRQLLSEGHHVTLWTRDVEKAHQYCGEHIKAVTALAMIPANETFDAVINLAGEPIADGRWTPSKKQKIERSRIGLTQQLVAWLAQHPQKPQCLISGSAVGWYGDQGDSLVTEQSDFHDEYSHQLCAQWEEAAETAQNLGIRVAIVRTGLVVAAEGGFLSKMMLPFKLGLGGRISHGQQYMPWIHLHDIARLFIFLSQHESAQGVFNGTAPNPVTNQQFTKALATSLKRPAFFPVPAVVLKVAFGEMSELLLGGQKAVPKKAQAIGFEFFYTDLQTTLNSVV